MEARQLLAGDLVGYWLADDIVAADGDTVSQWDDQISSLPAGSVGSPTWVADAVNGRAAVNFDPGDGDDGFRVRSAQNPLAGATDFSVAVVFSTDSGNLTGANDEWFKNTGLVDSNALGFSTDWGVSINASGQIAAGMGGGFGVSPETIYSTSTGLNDGQLHLAVVTRSGSTMSIYIDDQVADVSDTFDSGARNSLDVTFGMLQTKGNAFDGQIAQIRMYDGALDDAELAALRAEVNAFYNNTAPVAQDDQYTLNEDPSLFFVTVVDGVLINDTDADNDALTATLVTPTQNGEIVLNANGSFIYSPFANFNGTDTFTYTADDFRPSNIATVTLEVLSVYDPPSPKPDQYKTIPTGTLQVDALQGVLANDTNVDDANMTAVLEQDVSDGTLTLSADGSFDYSPGGFSGVATFSYRVDDGIGLSAPATVTLVVNAIPQPNDDAYSVDEDQVLDVSAAGGILANDVDSDGGTLAATLETDPTQGTLTLAQDGSFQYTPNADFFGQDEFTYTVSDGVDSAGPATVLLTINSVNDEPMITPDTYVATGSRLDVDAARGVLSNDVDIDGPLLTAELMDGPQNGALDLRPDGSFLYEPLGGFTGQDRFTYRVNDSLAVSEVAEVVIIVQPSTTKTSTPTGDSIVTFNELMYNPDGSQSRLEWLELHNQMGIDMDISQWRLTGGIYFEFPDGTVIPGNGFLIVAANPQALEEDTGVTGALGPFTGRLSNGGEELFLRNNSDRIMDIIDYNDNGDWPVGPDGSGSTLAKIARHLATDESRNWSTSREIGGTPGATNFSATDLTPVPTPLMNWDTTISYDDQGADLGTAWRDVGFDASSWPSAAGIFQAGDPQFPPDNPGGLAEPGVGLYSYWPLDETGGNVAPNLVAGGAEGSLQRSPRWATDDQRGQVLNLDGTNDHVIAGTLPAIGVNDDFTWAFWFKQDSVRNANAVIIGNRSGGQQNPLQFTKFTPTNFEYYSGAPDPSISFSVANGRWAHMAVVKSGPNFTYYVNGEVIGTGQTQHDAAPNPFFIGGDPGASREYADGQIDDVALWTRDLPADAIIGLADGSYTPLTAPTVFVGGPIIPEDLPDEQVTLSNAADTYYFRREFSFDGDPSQTELRLTTLIDDGAVFYLNGTEIYRNNMPAGPIDANTPASSEIDDIGGTGPIVLPGTALQRGDNVLAVEVHKSGDVVNDALFAVELIADVTPLDLSNVPLPILNEITAGGDTFSVELFNPTDQSIDLAGYRLGETAIAAGTIGPGEFFVVDPSVLGNQFSDGDNLFLITPDGQRVADAQRVADHLIGRDANNDGDWFHPTQASFGAANIFQVDQNIVINELVYHAPGTYVPQLDQLFVNNEQWIELYNRSDAEIVDLSGWSFGEGIRFVIPQGVTMPPDSYLVISNDPAALIRERPELDPSIVLGPFSRNLSNSGENVQLLDQNGNQVDAVHYFDGGRWPDEADGNGGSLELRDPLSDNSIAEAWAGSDESDQVGWKTFTFRGSGRGNTGDPQQYNEFLLGLLDDGVVLIDDVIVIESPGTPGARQLIQNGSFEGDSLGGEADKWRIIGNQKGSVQVDPDDPANQVLRIVATGPTEHMNNNAGTTLKFGEEFVRLSNSKEYEISFRARWVSGSNQLNSRLYFNRLGRSTRLDRPTSVGTPGQVNSQRVDNAAPTLDGMLHSPAVPNAGQPVEVTIQASDPQGIGSTLLWYSVEGGAWASVTMTDDGNGLYRGEIPGQARGALVHFYVESKDTAGATSMFPADGPEARALYRVQDGQAADGPRQTLRILMTAEDTTRLHELTNVMSNDRIGATVIYSESEIFYNVGVRLKGSERGRFRDVRVGFNIGFDPSQLFRGVHSTIGIDRSGAGDEFSQKEIIVRQIINRAGEGPQIYDDLIHVIAPDGRHTGSAMLNMARYNDVFLDSQYENGSQGTAFEYELIYYPTTTDGGGPEDLKRPTPDAVSGVPMRGQGDDKEAYRNHWLIENNRRRDDYSRLIDMLNVIGGRQSDPNFQDDLSQVVDVDQWLRAFAVTILTGIGDNYSGGSQHNAQFYVRPSDNRVLYLPWDMDFSFSAGVTTGLVTNSEQRKMMDDPGNERAYYGHVLDIIDTSFNSEYIDPWIDHFDELTPGQAPFRTFKSYIKRRSEFAVGRVEAAIPTVPFEIATASPVDVGDASTARLGGTAWVDVREIRLAGSEIPLNVTWVTNSQWEIDVPVNQGVEDVVLEAYGFQGELLSSASINIASTGSSAVRDFLRVAEVHYNPADPSGNDLFVDNGEFEFIEFVNTGDQPIELGGVQLVQVTREGELEGVRFAFGQQTLQPNERTVVAKNRDAFLSRYGDEISLADGQGDASQFGAFSGQLSNGGETLTVIDPFGAIVQQFVYDDNWYSDTDGDGLSLEFLDPTVSDLDAWNNPRSWSASATLHGTPGTSPLLPGDANMDGIFDSADLILALQAGEYEDDIPGNSTFAEGDWNGDGDFDTNDLVVAFARGGYVDNSVPIAATPQRSLSLQAAAVESIFSDRDERLDRRR